MQVRSRPLDGTRMYTKTAISGRRICHANLTAWEHFCLPVNPFAQLSPVGTSLCLSPPFAHQLFHGGAEFLAREAARGVAVEHLHNPTCLAIKTLILLAACPASPPPETGRSPEKRLNGIRAKPN